MVRSDAARNRARLLDSARIVFAEKGFDATLDDVARHAGVGVATAYRHFTDKYAIAGEVLAEATQQIATNAHEALAIDDPWTALVTFFEATAARLVADRGLLQALAGQGRVSDKERIWPDIVDAVTALFERAHAAGAIRADAKPQDAGVILSMVGGIAGVDWRRYLAMLLDGLRATDRPALPGAAPVFGELDDVIIAAGRKPGRR